MDKWSKDFDERPHRTGVIRGKFNATFNASATDKPIGTVASGLTRTAERLIVFARWRQYTPI